MRYLALSSPEMHGSDIKALQKVLNERLRHYKRHQHIRENGIYDRETLHAVATVAYDEGLHHYDGSTAVTKLIIHPHLRLPAQLQAEHERKLKREHHGTIAPHAQGLARIPAIAAHYIGVHENPAGSNWGEPHPADWERNFGFSSGAPWCAMFASSMVNAAGGSIHGGNPAFCPNLESYARSRVNGFDLWKSNHGDGVGPGWLVLYNWVGGSEPEHVGIVESLHGDHLVAIEGNTGNGEPQWGGMVARESRPYNFTVGYCRPRM